MNSNKLFFFVGVLFIVFLNSCAPAYVPSVVNAPLLTNKGEIQAALYTGTAGFDPQFTYALSNHLGMMINGSFANRISDSTDDFHRHQFMEFGVGYFTNFGSRMKFETFGGLGSGEIQAEYDNSIWISRSDVKYTRFFIQPSIGVTSKIFDFGISSRFVIVSLNQESKKSSGYFFEPVITGKLGYDHIKAVLQMGLSLPFNEEKISFNYQPLLLSLGIQGNFGKMFK